MTVRLTALVAGALVAAAALLPGAASAQPESKNEAPAAPQPDRTHNLDFLLGALKVAPDDSSAKAIEERIWALWLSSGGDTANLLMSRVKTAVEAEDLDLALRLLDAMVEIRPQYLEAWDRRATVFYMKKDYASALADLRQVLRREPRHFGALSMLGSIMQELGDDKEALAAYRAALAVHPHLKDIPDKVKALADKVEGRAI